jgi:plasmid replication initiation protein
MKGEIVKKPDELIKMRGEFSESELKLSTYLIAQLEENKYIYQINIKDYLKKFDKKIGDFDYLYEVALNLSKKQFKMFDRVNKRFSIYNFFGAVEYSNGVLEIEFSSKLMKYLLQIKNNYLRYEIKNIMSLDSKYSIRLYEILKNKYEKTKKFRKDCFFRIGVDELKEVLRVPRSYRYGIFKKRILEKAQSELKEKTDIYFSFEEIKKGRKVDEIVFNIFSKRKKLQTENRIYKTDNDFTQWRKELQKKDGLVLKINNQVFEIKDGLLAKNSEILDKEEAWKSWKFLYKNRDKIKFLNKEDLKKEANEEIKQKILEVFKDKEFKAIPVKIDGNIEYLNANLINIKDFEDVNNFVAIFKSGERTFAMKLGLETLKGWLI